MKHKEIAKMEFNIKIYTHRQLYEKYDKELRYKNPKIQDFGSQIDDFIYDNYMPFANPNFAPLFYIYISKKDLELIEF